MSVVPFILNDTVVSAKEDYKFDGDAICIIDLDTDQVEKPETGNASYDLRVGGEYRDHRNLGKTELNEGQSICLQPGSAVIIETAEEVKFPKKRFGHIVPKVSLLQKGISNTSSKIDPGYEGKLLVTVFNLGKQKVDLQKGSKFCTLYVLEIQSNKETKVSPYRKRGQRIIGNHKRNFLQYTMDFIEHKNSFFTALLLVVTTILSVTQLIALFKTGEPSSPSKSYSTITREISFCKSC